jgi:branched-chain amino acid aminotransferase
VFDHGLLYGDGVFEGIRSYNGLIFKLREHVERLFASARVLALTIPLTRAQVIAAVRQTMRANRLKDAYIRLVVTRGVGDLGLDPRKCTRPTIFIITDRIVLYPEAFYRQGLSLVTVPTRRNIPEALSPQVKSLNYLNNILAKIEAINMGAEEALMLNHQGEVAECTGDNLFIVKDGALLTPPNHVGALRGITAGCVVDLARKRRIAVREAVMTRYDLFTADEAFLTGTAAEVIPVVRLDGRTIGDGRPGRVTQRLMADFRKRTTLDGVRV